MLQPPNTEELCNKRLRKPERILYIHVITDWYLNYITI